MEIKFLGTGAAEGIPALFCNCVTCQNTRKLKGKNIRKRSSLLINNDLLIDMGPDLSISCTIHDVNLNSLKYILVTHCHFDHFYPENLEIRSERYQYNNFPDLKLLGNSSVFYKLNQMGYKDEELHINRIEAELYKKYMFGEYVVEPIPANHAHEFGMALNYIVKFNNKSLLYATDTGIYEDSWIQHIKNEFFDCIIIDGTNLFTNTSTNHLNLDGLKLMLKKLSNANTIDSHTIIICTHFSHEGIPLHDKLQNKLHSYNIIAAFDGMTLTL